MHMPELGQVGLCPSLMCYSNIATSYQMLRCRLCCKRPFRELGNWAKLWEKYLFPPHLQGKPLEVPNQWMYMP